MTPEQYVQKKAAGSGSSFYYAFMFLPAERRAAITAFYAFCREVDDVVDEVKDAGIAQQKLFTDITPDEWKNKFKNLFKALNK